MKISIFQVDAFSSMVFKGNPAAVCPLETWLDEETMQAIAAENNLSETAFFVREGDTYKLRWFTPQCEVDLCGHATLASGFVLLNILETKKSSVQFQTRSGLLGVDRFGELLAMDFPSLPPRKCDHPPADLLEGLSLRGYVSAPEVLQTRNNYFVVYENEGQVRNARPNFSLLEKLHPFGVCITAPGTQSDFVSRYFVPSYGILEDPVTGSTHSSLTPYWAGALAKTSLHAQQLSRRGGELWCEMNVDRVILRGAAALYLTGSISV